MKFGLILPQNTPDPADLLNAARLSEEGGLDSIWVVDNLQERPDPTVPFLECWVGLCAAAAATSRIALGTLVQRITLRRPRVAASMAATLDVLAPGRLILGLGVGDSSSREEQAAYGVPFGPKAERFKRLEETVQAVREAAPQMPLWLGGESDETLAHVPMFDGWNFWGPASRFPERADRARSVADGKALEISWSGPWRDFNLGQVQAGGAEHVILATNAANYRERIEMLKNLIPRTEGISHD